MRILWLKTELLHPVDKGGKIRTYNMLKALKRSCPITYLALDDGTADQNARELATEYCHDLVCVPQKRREKFTAGFYAELLLNVSSRLPYAIKKYESNEMRHEIAERHRKRQFDVLVCDFLAPAVNVPATLSAPSVLFQHNVEALIWKRHYSVQVNPVKKAYLYGQWLKMRSFERKACSWFDSVVAVSRDDRELMQSEYGVETIYDVPTGVDTSFFQPRADVQRIPNSLLFTGSMDWLPNQDAIRYFTEQIMPRIKQVIPDVTLTVVGRDPHPELLELSKRDHSVLITGRVDDVRPYMQKAAVYVVPLRIGGGTRLKIFEAMAMEQAIVSTRIGAEGLSVRDGVELLLADTPEAFAQAVIKLLSTQALAKALGDRAAATVRESFGWDRVAESFGTICERTLSGEGKRAKSMPSDRRVQSAV